MKASKIIAALTSDVQGHLDALYFEVGVPAPESALDQVGLRDGAETVGDFLRHGEEGLAFEHLLYMIVEPDLELSAAAYEKLTTAGTLLGIAPEAWSAVRHVGLPTD